MDPYGYGYVGDVGGGYVVEGGYDGYDGGYSYGPQIIEQQPIEYYGGPQYVEEGYPQAQPYLVEEEIYAPAYLEPGGIEHPSYMEPIYGYGDPYGASPFIDGLVGMGYNGPWPSDYYDQGHMLPAPYQPACRPAGRKSRPRKHHRDESSDSDSSDDDHYHHHKHVHKHCQRRPMMPQNNGITKDDIQSLLDKFESAMNLKYKRAQVTELEAENHVLKSLAKEKRDIQKQVAQNRRALLMKEALDFNVRAPVPGRRNPPGQQVVSIDFGQNGGQAPCPIAPNYAHPPPNPGLCPESRPMGAAAYSGGAVTYR